MAKKHGLKIEKNRVQPTENISLIFGSVNFTKEITRNYLKKLLEQNAIIHPKVMKQFTLYQSIKKNVLLI